MVNYIFLHMDANFQILQTAALWSNKYTKFLGYFKKKKKLFSSSMDQITKIYKNSRQEIVYTWNKSTDIEVSCLEQTLATIIPNLFCYIFVKWVWLILLFVTKLL